MATTLADPTERATKMPVSAAPTTTTTTVSTQRDLMMQWLVNEKTRAFESMENEFKTAALKKIDFLVQTGVIPEGHADKVKNTDSNDLKQFLSKQNGFVPGHAEEHNSGINKELYHMIAVTKTMEQQGLITAQEGAEIRRQFSDKIEEYCGVLYNMAPETVPRVPIAPFVDPAAHVSQVFDDVRNLADTEIRIAQRMAADMAQTLSDLGVDVHHLSDRLHVLIDSLRDRPGSAVTADEGTSAVMPTGAGAQAQTAVTQPIPVVTPTKQPQKTLDDAEAEAKRLEAQAQAALQDPTTMHLPDMYKSDVGLAYAAAARHRIILGDWEGAKKDYEEALKYTTESKERKALQNEIDRLNRVV